MLVEAAMQGKRRRLRPGGFARTMNFPLRGEKQAEFGLRLPFWQGKWQVRTPFSRFRMRFLGARRGRSDTASEGTPARMGAENGTGNESK